LKELIFTYLQGFNNEIHVLDGTDDHSNFGNNYYSDKVLADAAGVGLDDGVVDGVVKDMSQLYDLTFHKYDKVEEVNS